MQSKRRIIKFVSKYEKNNIECKKEKINAIYFDADVIAFYKDGLHHNSKNAAFINNKGFKYFYLNNKCYGFEYHFNKESWRRFVKLQVFYEFL